MRTTYLLVFSMMLLLGSPSAGVAPPEWVLSWGGASGYGDGQFTTEVSGVAVDPSGLVYVVDSFFLRRVQVFTSDGVFISKWSYSGSAAGYPGIAIDGDGNVYLAKDLDCRVEKFTAAGVLLSSWGGDGTGNGQFRQPMGIAVDRDGYVYVADTGNHRIQKFTSNGTFLKA